MTHYYHWLVFAFAAVLAFVSASAGQTPTSTDKQGGGPVQGYQSGYDPIDKSKAPAASGGRKSDPEMQTKAGATGQPQVRSRR